ncbi:MAG: sulfotransferase domain-containing protein [Pseudomonadota bacterium]
MKKSIIWLASYPKSGNTWTRIFLANYMMNADKPVPINQVHRFGMGDTITKTYQMVAGGPFDLKNHQTILTLRDKVLRGIVGNNADVNFVKTHNIRDKAFGVDLIPPNYTRSAVYIMRDPRDVLISYARHFGQTHSQALEAISSKHNVTNSDQSTVFQYLGSWSGHVNSWTRNTVFPTKVLRYEDMQTKPVETFGSLLKHIGIPVDPARLEKAVRFSSFDELSKQESEDGFAEASGKTEKFFAKGISGQWVNELENDLVDEICKRHAKVMKKYGYLDGS